jgi:hypothetical protein
MTNDLNSLQGKLEMAEEEEDREADRQTDSHYFSRKQQFAKDCV